MWNARRLDWRTPFLASIFASPAAAAAAAAADDDDDAAGAGSGAAADAVDAVDVIMLMWDDTTTRPSNKHWLKHRLGWTTMAGAVQKTGKRRSQRTRRLLKVFFFHRNFL